MPFVYVLSPYTSPSEVEMNVRAHYAACAVAELMEKPQFDGYVFFSPVVHYHQVAVRSKGLPRDVSFWWNINLTFMRMATHAVVLQMPGWKESNGIRKELHWFSNNQELSNAPAEIIYYNTNWENF